MESSNMEQVLSQRKIMKRENVSPDGRLQTYLFSILTLAAFIWGWQADLENYITAESGLGYALGIMGGTMMLVMLFYSLRKRIRFMRHLGETKHWFKLHMALGVLGPLCILYHCNFSLGSTNSNVALFCMLLVAGSGLIGRYIYRQIHFGLYGRKATVTLLKEEFIRSRQEIDALFKRAPDLEGSLFRIKLSELEQINGLLNHFISMLTMSFRGRITYLTSVRTLARACGLLAKRENWDQKTYRRFYRESRKALAIYYSTIRKIAGFQFYERMFALWHVLHIPLFIMMIITGITHVFAVHLY